MDIYCAPYLQNVVAAQKMLLQHRNVVANTTICNIICCKFRDLQQHFHVATTFSCCNIIIFACSNISMLKQHFILLQQHNYWYNKPLATTKYVVTKHNVVAIQIMLSQHWNVVANMTFLVTTKYVVMHHDTFCCICIEIVLMHYQFATTYVRVPNVVANRR